MLKRGIHNFVCFDIGLLVLSKVYNVQFSQRDIMQCKLKIRMSISPICPVFMVQIFKIMFTVTHPIQAPILLSTCCEISSI